MNTTYPYVIRRMLICSAGGAANGTHAELRDGLRERFGRVPECIASLAIDYESDPPAGFSVSETGLIALPGDPAAVAERVRAGEPDVAWLSQLLPADVLARYAGHEAAQIPAFTRAALAWTAHEDLGKGQPQWLDLIRSRLIDLAPGGIALHDVLENAGIPVAALDAAPTIVGVFIAGAEGGTGSAALIPLAIAARWLAAALGVKLEAHAWIITGHYRPKDGDESAKSALAYALDRDLEYVMSAVRSSLTMPLGPDVFAEVKGRLFDSIFREEAAGRLLHNYPGMLAQVSQDLLFTYTTVTARDLMRSHVNKTFKPRLRSLGSQPSWVMKPQKRKAAFNAFRE